MSQTESNNIKACALPSIHLPLTREARTWCGARDGCGFGRVDMGEGWCDNPSGSRPNFFGRQHLTFDKGGKFSAGQGIVHFF